MKLFQFHFPGCFEGKKKRTSFETLKANKVALTPAERQLCFDRKCIWNFHPSGLIPAVWKGKDSSGKLWYVTSTHRAYNKTSTLKGTIKRYHGFIKGTA